MPHGPSGALRTDAFAILREIAALRDELRELRRLDMRRIEDELATTPALGTQLRQDVANDIAAAERRLAEVIAARNAARAAAGASTHWRHVRAGAIHGVGAFARQFTRLPGAIGGILFLLVPLLALPRLGPIALLAYAGLPGIVVIVAVAGAIAGVLAPYWGDSVWGRAAIGVVAVVPPFAAVNILAAPASLSPGALVALTAIEALFIGVLFGATWPWIENV